MTTKKLSLAEFALSKQPPPCKLCVLAERNEIDEAYRKGVPRRVILEWLQVVKGYESNGPSGVTGSAVDKHYTNRHHHKTDS